MKKIQSGVVVYATVFASMMVSVPVMSSGITAPLYDISSLTYEGVFRMPKGTFGDSRVPWTSGKIAVKDDGKSFYFSGGNQLSIAEFEFPDNISKSEELSEVVIINNPIQGFSNIIDRAETGNPEGIDRIVGMSYLNNQLVVNTAKYYDGNASNEHTTLIIEKPDNLHESNVRGFMRLEGEVHSAGWVSPIPHEYQTIFGHDRIAGHASNLPINARSSMGPSAFLLDSDKIISSTSGEAIETIPLLDFSLKNPLHADTKNSSLENDLWTELSEAHYGFIVPGTSTYLTIGQSAGHESGIGYKITQPNGRECGGFCAYDHKDRYNYIWLWDLNDLVSSLNGDIEPHQIQPYYYGEIDMPFQESSDGSYTQNRIIGATLTPEEKLLVVVGSADRLQSRYESLPVVLQFDLFPPDSRPMPPMNFLIQ